MASIAAFQPILEGGSYVGCVVRTDAAAHGLDGPWNVYRYVGAPIASDSSPRDLTVARLDDDADYVPCGRCMWLSDGFALFEHFRHKCGEVVPLA